MSMRKMLERIIDLFTVLVLLSFAILVPLSLVCVIVAVVCGA